MLKRMGGKDHDIRVMSHVTFITHSVVSVNMFPVCAAGYIMKSELSLAISKHIFVQTHTFPIKQRRKQNTKKDRQTDGHTDRKVKPMLITAVQFDGYDFTATT